MISNWFIYIGTISFSGHVITFFTFSCKSDNFWEVEIKTFAITSINKMPLADSKNKWPEF